MIKYYDAEASSDSAELEDMNNAYVYAYKNNYRADSHHSEIIGDRYTANKPRVKKVNRTRNSEYRTNIVRNSEYNRNSIYNSNIVGNSEYTANIARNSMYNSNATLDEGIYSYRANNDELKRKEKIYNRRIVGDKNNVSNKDKIRKSAMERKKNIIRIFDVIICFLMLMLISYRYATIDANFRQKENLKKELASIQKENEQLKVNIEKKMNFNAIEQEAKEKLGMQKLDNNQKVYVNLNKSDYIEPSESVSNTENQKEETWWCKLLKDLFKIDN